MKCTAVLKGDKAPLPTHAVGSNDCFWTVGAKAPDNGIIVSFSTEHEQLSGGVFITEDRLTELSIVLERLQRKRDKKKESESNE